MKAVRSKCRKYLKKFTSISKNTSTAEIEGGSRDLRLSSMTIGNSSLIRSVCERDHKMDIYGTDWLRSTFYCYLLSENLDDSNSDYCASAVVIKIKGTALGFKICFVFKPRNLAITVCSSKESSVK